MDTISRQDAVKAIEHYTKWGDCDSELVTAAINALPAVECKQCIKLVHEINGLKDALAQAEGIIADLRAQEQTNG